MSVKSDRGQQFLQWSGFLPAEHWPLLSISVQTEMAATATGTVPPAAHPGPNGGNFHSCPNGSASFPGNQDPRLQSTTQEPGPSAHPPPNVSARPVFYVPAPPPPPFLQYQWPMPFPYNPFTGFPGIGESFSIYFNFFSRTQDKNKIDLYN